MNVEIKAEAALFPEREYIKGIFVAVHTANEGSVRFQYKCLVPLYVHCIPRNETVRPRHFQNRIIMFCLPISTFMYL